MTGFDQGVDVADGGTHGVGAVFLLEGDEAVDGVEHHNAKPKPQVPRGPNCINGSHAEIL
jgi:hypothetical protein